MERAKDVYVISVVDAMGNSTPICVCDRTMPALNRRLDRLAAEYGARDWYTEEQEGRIFVSLLLSSSDQVDLIIDTATGYFNF